MLLKSVFGCRPRISTTFLFGIADLGAGVVGVKADVPGTVPVDCGWVVEATLPTLFFVGVQAEVSGTMPVDSVLVVEASSATLLTTICPSFFKVKFSILVVAVIDLISCGTIFGSIVSACFFNMSSQLILRIASMLSLKKTVSVLPVGSSIVALTQYLVQ
ncbi:hypothetical protein CASFOL_040764 [Castilleja foliolosa]|uniref:Uncharacterized protein n=1 Tax=Castilleja foliolosa TaxID=1961234 RepID=A0ABD3BCJ6_9LAMI